MQTREDAKEYLLQIKYLTNNIKDQEQYIQRLRDTMGILGISYERERVQSSPEVDRFAHVFAQIEEQEKVLESLKVNLIETKVNIINMIHELENEKHRKVLNLHYVDLKSLKKASNIMCFSYDYVKELHLEALDAFLEKFPLYNT